ncbi:MBL fold metallo-hydrolase [Arthrobacter sp. JZ12]|uniref:MBL fold metallo-hydrolase n=1 Tax=Arthrobacter sp. JZ12 TaxID=2654190 RepID=UPI002B47FCFE|nr:MBL fold metallo-hydrolase [Arthrobacter sp. JZ12]
MKDVNRRTALAGISAAAVAASVAHATAAHATPGRPGMPKEVRMTWFGISNWHYQIGELGIVLDGAVGFPAAEPNPEVVQKVRGALEQKGAIQYVLLGHQHGDHSVDTPEWVKQTGATLIASANACAEAAAYGIPASQLQPVKGGERFQLSPYVEMHVVKWVHSVRVGATSPADGGIETFGFVFKVQTPSKILTLYVSDSGAGGPELTKEHVVNGENRGAPLSNLGKAMRAADLQTFEVWQPGPESRLVTQARVLVPTFRPKYLMPHHLGARGGFNLFGGLHYGFQPEEVPKLMSVLNDFNVPLVAPVNYFDAWAYDRDGLRSVDNSEMKISLGLPASGPGPNPQGPNPRTGDMEGPDD